MRSLARDKFLRDLLRYFACKSPGALALMMHDASPELACGAAHLLLDGHEFGAWRARPCDLRLARNLTTKSNREAKSMRKPMQPLTWNDLGPIDCKPIAKPRPGSSEFMASIRRMLETHHHMNATLCDPKATPHMKIAAMKKWIAALDANGMADVVPARIRKGLAAAASKIERNTR